MTDCSNIKYFSQPDLWNKAPVEGQTIVADDIISMIPDNIHSILDVGCGNGTVINRLNKKWDTFGCDISEVALRHVNAIKTVADISNLPYPDNAFDLVISSDVIEHIADDVYEQALFELSRVAKRYVLIAVPYEELLEAAEVVCPKCTFSYHAHLHQRSYSIEQMTQLFNKDFGVKQIKLSGERWLYYDENLVKNRRNLTEIDYPFESALCPKCKTRRGNVDYSPSSKEIARRFDSLQAMLSLNNIQPLPNKSEILVLFERGIKSIEIDTNFNEYIKPDNLAEINFSLLKPCQNIPNYPDKIMCIKDSSNIILAIPQLPKSLKIKKGRCRSIEIYDSVKECYLNCKYLTEDTLNIPQVPNDARGSLVRFSGYTSDLVLISSFSYKRSKEEILSICFSDNGQMQKELLLELEKITAIANELELKRATLNTQVISLQESNEQQARTFASESAHLQEVNQGLIELVNKLELELDAINLSMLKNKKIDDKENTKSILIFSHMYPRDYNKAGGIFVHEQVKSLRARGIDARVVSGEPFWINTCNPLKIIRALKSYKKNVIEAWDEYDGVPVLRLPYIVSNILPFQYHAFTYTQGILRHTKWIYNTFKFTLIHAHTAYLDGSAAAKVASYYKVPFVITEHTGPFKTLTRTPYLRRKTEKSIKKADSLIAVSDSLLKEMSQQIASIHLCNAIVVPNVVDTELFTIQPTDRRRQNPTNCIKMLWVGHFVPVKRVAVLLKAFSMAIHACESTFQFHLKLVGSGDGEQVARELAKNLGIDTLIEFAGHANRNDLVSHYNSCDFLIISSESETFGVVAIEAMSSGCPVLTTNCGGPEEIITHQSLGAIVDKSAEAIAKGMQDMANRIHDFKPELIQRVAQLRFSREQIGEQLEEIYDCLL
jgi:glycosyltransferase involved in cell wall biosynthesis/ubiquinone/menaquinone biosynthesis C-methylase UbiE